MKTATKLMIALSAMALAGCMHNEYQTDIHVERIDRKHMPAEEVPVIVLPPVVVDQPVVDQPLMEIPTPPPLVEVITLPPRMGHGPVAVGPISLEDL